MSAQFWPREAEQFYDSDEGTAPQAAAAITPPLEQATIPATQRPAKAPPIGVSPAPAKAPPSSAKAKAPPPELVQFNEDYEFRNLADDAAPALTPWPINSPPPPATENAEPGPEPLVPLESSSSAQSQSEQRTTTSQGTASTAPEMLLLRPPIRHNINDRQVPENARANFTEVPDGFYNTHRTRRRTMDIRVPREVWLRWLDIALPRQQLWASPLFEDLWIATERDFIKVWHMAAQTHDNGIRHMWKEYCEARGDGTQDPYRVSIGFSRTFLHIYCCQDADFFTQHISARLLPLWKEEALMIE